MPIGANNLTFNAKEVAESVATIFYCLTRCCQASYGSKKNLGILIYETSLSEILGLVILRSWHQ